MAAYLKIENPGVAPSEAFTLLGASTKRSQDGQIGKFGTGNKQAVGVLLRAGLQPVIFAGNLKLEFGTREQVVNDGIKNTTFNRVVVKFGGKDAQGVSRSSTEDLGFVLEHGATDWTGVDLAMREFVSNAIDRAVEEGEYAFNFKWQADNGIASENRKDADVVERYRAAARERRKTAKDFLNVSIEVVNESQVRAKAGTTRIFIPMNADVFAFYEQLGKWFLHFSEPELIGQTILPKGGRNLGNRTAAVIYRRGVRVREFESKDTPSLFDYNLENLELDESRKVDDWRVQYEAAKALAAADKATLTRMWQSFIDGGKYWEQSFDSYGLENGVYKEEQKKLWQESFEAAIGKDGVAATGNGGEMAAKKGYNVIVMPEAFVQAAEKYGVRTPAKVLSQDDREGREIMEATPEVDAAANWAWKLCGRHTHNGKEIPEAKCFKSIMNGGAVTNGFYRDNCVYINIDIADTDSRKMRSVMLEEIVHHITNAGDMSRDLQQYMFELATVLAD